MCSKARRQGVRRSLCFCAMGIVLTLGLMGVASLGAQVAVEVETGRVWTGYNDVRVPKSTGTMLSLSDQLTSTAASFVRVRLSYQLAPRHTLSILVAPLRLQGAGSFPTPVMFAGTSFPADTRLTSRYRFDSYRLTYRYALDDAGPVRVAVGVTAKVRDAAIHLEAPGLSGETTNTGFVPLLSFRATWQPWARLMLVVDGDALAAPQGRAEDVLVALAYAPAKKLQLYGGYRLLEGGADVEQVYNFALFHYLALGARWSFR
ncbi:MAG: hypothetical protein ONB30_05915 [candidate division KSB1 bacterium]|nr:hypothetical protein [candidate division KSB1 bacterium]